MPQRANRSGWVLWVYLLVPHAGNVNELRGACSLKSLWGQELVPKEEPLAIEMEYLGPAKVPAADIHASGLRSRWVAGLLTGSRAD